MYYLYHIPGKKIGVTRDLHTRVTLVQGYKEGEYEVLDQSEDIDYISDLELELQQSYGYRKDLQPYKNLFNKMKINATEQTSTFPCPVNKLKGRLLDNVGMTWQTDFGEFEISTETIPWIMENVKTSMFNNNRSYIYNKAFYEEFLNNQTRINFKDIAGVAKAKYLINDPKEYVYFDLIRQWAEERGLYDHGDPFTQYIKLSEEFGELAKGLLKSDEDEIVDAIGDMVVVLTNLAHQCGTSIEDCIESAYNVISKRTGKMINGTFVKDINMKDYRIKTEDPIVQKIIKKIDERSEFGMKKYGQSMMQEVVNREKDLGAFIVDVQEELMDAILYLESARHCLQDEIEDAMLARLTADKNEEVL